MIFEVETVYHVYNQGNNREAVFLSESDYRLFEDKMRVHLHPFAHVVAYCLMPNHFHWLLVPKERGVQYTAPHPHQKAIPMQLLCKSIGTLLSSYTQKTNRKYGWSGSLFRKGTKSKAGSIRHLLDYPEHFPKKRFYSNMDYARICLEYIHQNPVKAGLSLYPTEWSYSSAKEWAGLPGNGICELEFGRKMLFGGRTTP
jgi:putative transposase